jgi:hypothetical protein
MLAKNNWYRVDEWWHKAVMRPSPRAGRQRLDERGRELPLVELVREVDRAVVEEGAHPRVSRRALTTRHPRDEGVSESPVQYTMLLSTAVRDDGAGSRAARGRRPRVDGR